MKQLVIFLLQSTILIYSCGRENKKYIKFDSSDNSSKYNEDSASNDKCCFKAILIGKQNWSIINLNVPVFRNGDPILEARTDEEWIKAAEDKRPAWCYYNNESNNGAEYGKLYNWYAVNDPRGLAPKGWHIPTDSEWKVLTEYLNFGAGEKMKSTIGWDTTIERNGPYCIKSSNNESGFSALPAGERTDYGRFEWKENKSVWWCVTEKNVNSAFHFYLRNCFSEIGIENINKASGMSVRCIRD